MGGTSQLNKDKPSFKAKSNLLSLTIHSVEPEVNYLRYLSG